MRLWAGGSPIVSEISKIFKEEEERVLVNKIIKEGLVKLATLHDYLEKEIQALS